MSINDLRDKEGNYLGKEHTTAEHRTVGTYRAWCHNCGEWCYPESPCGEPKCCAALTPPTSPDDCEQCARPGARSGHEPNDFDQLVMIVAERMKATPHATRAALAHLRDHATNDTTDGTT